MMMDIVEQLVLMAKPLDINRWPQPLASHPDVVHQVPDAKDAKGPILYQGRLHTLSQQTLCV